MNHLKTYLVHYAAVIAGICSLIAGADPKLLGPEGASIVGAAVTGVAVAHALGIKPETIAKAAAPILLAALLLPLGGCVTTAAQRSALAALTDGAVIAVVQKGNPAPAVMQARAVKIKQIATEIEAVNTGALQSLPAVLQAVTPLLAAAGLNPAEMILAQQLVGALQLQLQAQLGANPKAAQIQTTVGVILDDVIAATAAYGA